MAYLHFSLIKPIRNVPSGRRIKKVEQKQKKKRQDKEVTVEKQQQHSIQSPAVSLGHRFIYHLCAKWTSDLVPIQEHWLLKVSSESPRKDARRSQTKESIFQGKLQPDIFFFFNSGDSPITCYQKRWKNNNNNNIENKIRLKRKSPVGRASRHGLFGGLAGSHVCDGLNTDPVASATW